MLIGYYFKLAWISLKKTPLLSALMIGTIAMGIAATMITSTVSIMMAKDPLPEKSERTFSVRLSSWSPDKAYQISRGEEVIPPMLTYMDTMNLLEEAKGQRQTAVVMYKNMVRSESQTDKEAKMLRVNSVNNDFFDMFNVPFLYGSPWSDLEDKEGAALVVLDKQTNDRLFSGANSVGQHILIGKHLARIVGVLDSWSPLPQVFHGRQHAHSLPFPIFTPFQFQINNNLLSKGEMSWQCWAPLDDSSLETFLASECVWIRYWVELSSAAQRSDYMDHINAYVEQQKGSGRFARENLSKVFNIKESLKEDKIVEEDDFIAVWLAFAFLVACLLNCMGLMLIKFYGKGAEVGLRRAVGASKQHIAIQFGCETVLIGTIGGFLGLALAQLGLRLTADIFAHLPEGLMQMTLPLVIMTVVLAVVSSTVFGLWPIYRAAQIQPSAQLKSL
ncbi:MULTISPECIES: ABC transporter permease [unclassified Pseudoalteromonas]|uniref:ABC transporter permease n=1 Tax=unclassified Pseudoalteromonas TaxID=194690 RepID=UPI00209826A7|nr:ABC transporter permease [Pseudoalteromonas sp. XMcav2-N]MCO7189747.1 ABC transporter permease [Pseudoalteromonas sp. XMcav2-N]